MRLKKQLMNFLAVLATASLLVTIPITTYAHCGKPHCCHMKKTCKEKCHCRCTKVKPCACK